MASSFRFRRFSVRNTDSALKVGTDAVLLGAAVTLKDTDRRLLDIGTGTGVIALMAAQRLSDITDCGSGRHSFSIDAIDIDAPSAAEAALNFKESPWQENLRAICCPLSAFGPEEKFDLIFSNPPYYDNSLVNPDARETAARHTGSLSYREICAFAAKNLCPEGRLAMILPSESETALKRTAASFGLRLFRILRIRPTAAKPVRRIIAEFSLSSLPACPADEELVLQQGNARAPEYEALTKDFYLQGTGS